MMLKIFVDGRDIVGLVFTDIIKKFVNTGINGIALFDELFRLL